MGRSFTTEAAMLSPETPLRDAIPRFLLSKQRLSDKSREEYGRSLMEFTVWANEPRLRDLNAELADQWVAMKKRTALYAARAGCAYLKSFASWLADERILRSDVGTSVLASVRTPRVPSEGRMPLTDEEVDRLWDAIRSESAIHRCRDAALVWLLFEDAHLDPRGPNWIEIRWHTSKGRKTRRITFGRMAAKAIAEYIDHDRRTYTGRGPECLFLTMEGKGFTETGMQSWLARLTDLFEAHGIRGWMAHRMRHTWASWYHRGSRETGKTVYDLKLEGGWNDLNIPLRYTHDRPWEELRDMPTSIEAIYARRRAV